MPAIEITSSTKALAARGILAFDRGKEASVIGRGGARLLRERGLDSALRRKLAHEAAARGGSDRERIEQRV
jgi:hypothetical protein